MLRIVQSHVMKNRDFFSTPIIYTRKLREVSRGLKKKHYRIRFFWRGFWLFWGKLLSNFHRKFAILETPWFLLASVNGPIEEKESGSSLVLKTLFNIVEERFKKIVELWYLCCIMVFRKVNKQPGMQKFWNWCSHYQEIYDWISPLNKRAGSAFILTQ